MTLCDQNLTFTRVHDLICSLHSSCGENVTLHIRGVRSLEGHRWERLYVSAANVLEKSLSALVKNMWFARGWDLEQSCHQVMTPRPLGGSSDPIGSCRLFPLEQSYSDATQIFCRSGGKAGMKRNPLGMADASWGLHWAVRLVHIPAAELLKHTVEQKFTHAPGVMFCPCCKKERV